MFLKNAKILWWTEWQISNKGRINIIFFSFAFDINIALYVPLLLFSSLKILVFCLLWVFFFFFACIEILQALIAEFWAPFWLYANGKCLVTLFHYQLHCLIPAQCTWGWKNKSILSCAEVLKVSIKKGWHVHVHSSTNSNRQKVQPTSPLTDEWISEMSYIHTKEHCGHAC